MRNMKYRGTKKTHGMILDTSVARAKLPSPFVYRDDGKDPPPATPVRLAPQRMRLVDYLSEAPASERALIARLRGIG